MWMGPMCHHECPYKREAEGKLDSEVEKIMWPQEAGIGSLWRPAKAGQQPPEARRTRNWFSEPLEGRWPCPHLGFDGVELISNFWLPELGDSVCCLGPPNLWYLLQQPQETNTVHWLGSGQCNNWDCLFLGVWWLQVQQVHPQIKWMTTKWCRSLLLDC